MRRLRHLFNGFARATVVAAAMTLLSGVVYADLLEYSFTGTAGDQRKLAPSAKYLNPKGNIEFALSAGVDRKLRVSIVNKSGAVLQSSTSHLLGVSDRIRVNGTEYYGAVLRLSAPRDGDYSVRAEILSGDEKTVIKVESHDFIVDTVPPTIAGDFFWNPTGYTHKHTDGRWIVSTASASGAGFTGVVDAGSGAGSATFTGEVVSGERYGEIYADNLPINLTNDGKVMIGNGAEGSIDLAFIPAIWADAKWTFRVTDRAGNSAVKEARVYIANRQPAKPEPFGVWDGSSNRLLNIAAMRGFIPYVPNMVINFNPIKMIYRVKRTDYRGGGGSAEIYGGLQWMYERGNRGDTTDLILHKDSEYMYMLVEAATDGKVMDVTRRNVWHTVGYRPRLFEHQIQFGSDSLIPPLATNLQAYVEGLRKWIPARYSMTKAEAGGKDFITKIKLDVEPRPYLQILHSRSDRGNVALDFECVVPANQTSCTASVRVPYPDDDTNTYHARPAVSSEDGKLRGAEIVYNWSWDGSIASLQTETVTIDRRQKTISYGVLNEFKSKVWSQAKVFNERLVFVNGEGREFLAKRVSVNIQDTTKGYDAQIYTATFDYSAVPQGTYDVFALFEDGFGTISINHQSKVQIFSALTIDAIPPSIEVAFKGDRLAIESLDDITIHLTDNLSSDLKIESVEITGGPTNERVNLTARRVQGNSFKLEYPILFPSMKAGESYTINVNASDESNNVGTKIVSFDYSPRTISLADGMDGRLMLPAVTDQFVRSGGGQIIRTEPVTLGDGAVVTGSYDVFATLRSDAKVALVVNGIRINPGQTMAVMNQHNFGASGGRIDLALRPAVAGVEGASSLLIMTSAPNSPVLLLDVNTWIGRAQLSADSWSVRQVIDPVNISASPLAGVPCRFTSDIKAAQSGDPIRDPVCLLEWTKIPDEAAPVESSNGDMKITSLQGQAVALGEQPVAYSLYLFSGDGRKISVGGGEASLLVTSAFGAIGLTPVGDLDRIFRAIQQFDVRMRQSTGPSCTLTMDAKVAQDAASKRALGRHATTCLFEWIEIPDGLQQDANSQNPYLFGSLREKEIYTLRWRVSIFTKNGTRVTLATESYNLEPVDPPAPVIKVTSPYQFTEGIYTVPLVGGHLGDALITSEASALDVVIKRGSDELTNETFHAGRAPSTQAYRRLTTLPMALWAETTFQIDASYNILPDIRSEKSFRAIAVPDTNIAPRIEVGVTEALDTAPLPITVKMVNRLNPGDDYDETAMGQWEIQLGREERQGELIPMTEYTDAPTGEVQFNVDLSGIDRSVRLVAYARLKSPIEGYERIAQSQRLFLTVLRGAAIDAGIKARRLAGPAPFITVLQLDLSDRLDTPSMGDIVWEMSPDAGATWETHVASDRNRSRWYKTFEKGEYLVRAKVINRHSGAESYTETVEVVAYDEPRVSIQGAETLFVGATETYSLKVLGPDGEEMSDAVIKWTMDKGKTFVHEGPTLTLTSDEPKRFSFQAWVRDPTAPDDQRYAYTRVRASANFRPIKGPRVYMTGPRVIEVGESYEYVARLAAPYRGMNVEMEGEFVMPDGSIVSGDTVTYSPTEGDLEASRIQLGYVAWVKGFRDAGSEASRELRARVWKYVWPNFGIHLNATASVAPVDVTARVRMLSFRGELDQPVYQWEFPTTEGFEERRSSGDNGQDIRTIRITQPGSYPVKVTITDARGHTATVEEIIEVGLATPYSVGMVYTQSNEFLRAPLELRVRPSVAGGHPRDRVEKYIYRVNGEQVEANGLSARAVLDEGSHQVSLTVATRMGHEITESLSFNVVPNKPPECAVSVEDRHTSWRFNAECSDPDGSMSNYAWTVNGDPVSVRANRLTLLKGSYNNSMPNVELIGYDDVGAASLPVRP